MMVNNDRGKFPKIQSYIGMVHMVTDGRGWSRMGLHGREWVHRGVGTHKEDNKGQEWERMCMHRCENDKQKSCQEQVVTHQEQRRAEGTQGN